MMAAAPARLFREQFGFTAAAAAAARSEFLLLNAFALWL
jgi:hypothetical protein